MQFCLILKRSFERLSFNTTRSVWQLKTVTICSFFFLGSPGWKYHKFTFSQKQQQPQQQQQQQQQQQPQQQQQQQTTITNDVISLERFI